MKGNYIVHEKHERHEKNDREGDVINVASYCGFWLSARRALIEDGTSPRMSMRLNEVEKLPSGWRRVQWHSAFALVIVSVNTLDQLADTCKLVVIYRLDHFGVFRHLLFEELQESEYYRSANIAVVLFRV